MVLFRWIKSILVKLVDSARSWILYKTSDLRYQRLAQNNQKRKKGVCVVVPGHASQLKI